MLLPYMLRSPLPMARLRRSELSQQVWGRESNSQIEGGNEKISGGLPLFAVLFAVLSSSIAHGIYLVCVWLRKGT